MADKRLKNIMTLSGLGGALWGGGFTLVLFWNTLGWGWVGIVMIVLFAVCEMVAAFKSEHLVTLRTDQSVTFNASGEWTKPQPTVVYLTENEVFGSGPKSTQQEDGRSVDPNLGVNTMEDWANWIRASRSPWRPWIRRVPRIMI